MTRNKNWYKIIKCLVCNEVKKHEAHGLCNRCYKKRNYDNRDKLNLCACGCGQKCVDRYVHGHNLDLSNNPNYGNHFSLDKDGYIRIDINGKRYLLHRLLYERFYKCCLLPYIILHHINGIKTDNRIENLEPMYRDQHLITHNINRWGY